MKKVLFPFAIGHTCYREPYVYAVKLARNLGAELILLTSFEIETDDTITKDKYDLLIKNNWIKAYREIILFHDYYLNDFARIDSELRIKVDHRIIHGKLVDEFRKIIHSETIDLVVMPVTGEADPSRKKLKQMQREVLNHPSISLMVTPCEKSYKPFNHVLFASAFKKINKWSEYTADLFFLASIHDSSVHFVNVTKHKSTDQDLKNEALQTIITSHQKQHRIFVHGFHGREVRNEMIDYMKQNDIQLFVVPKIQMNMVGEFFRGNMIEEVCSDSRIPIIILREREKG